MFYCSSAQKKTNTEVILKFILQLTKFLSPILGGNGPLDIIKAVGSKTHVNKFTYYETSALAQMLHSTPA